MAKRLFNFYLDDEVKEAATEKIERLLGKQSKGQLASFIRVLLSNFVHTADADVDKRILKQIEEEYVDCVKTNKRSKM